ncbi:hypothetical protein F2P81_020425 [Scophthalmus maximus]|uniref:Aftiphilin clathrin-binding box domain-containing protein n=1 Tax=Scophthalmus maximus TaxID=52904 RepID=A0A6A4SAB4_SCOMX|nr:hypothetical protein F2P81_020425 [Scophthalmus maximus]
MEPYIIPYHSSSPPPLDDDGDGEAGSEDDEFGDFGGFCSPPGIADSTKPPSSLRKPPPTTKAATHPPSCNINHPVELPQTVPTLSLGSGRAKGDVEEQGCNAESTLHLTNGYAEGDHNSGAHGASVAATCSPTEETGFADFTVFAEQAAHPWCCGLTPLGSAEAWAGGVEGTNSAKEIFASGREAVMESEPRSQCAYKAKANVCTKIKHCEKRDAAVEPPSQDHQPQEAAAALRFPSDQPHFGEEVGGKRGDSWREMRYRLNYLQTAESQEDEGSEKGGEKTVPQTICVYESECSEDLASVCDDFSFEGVSAEWEPNVSSLASLGDQSDLDRTDDEDEELGSNWHSHAFGNSSKAANLSQTEAEQAPHRCDQSLTQETTATSNQQHSITDAEDEFADFNDGGSEHRRDRDWVQTADVRVQSLGSLPPSDSFADFCSAPTQEEDGGEGSWAEFQDQRAPEEGSRQPDRVSSLQADGNTEEEQNRVGQCGDSRRNSCQVFMGMKKQPVAVPAFASGLGMLEPTKDAVPALCSTGYPAREPPGPQDIPHPSTGSVQELDWSSRGLSSSQDGTSPRRAPHFWGRK